ncbi:hypothetical protein P20311_2103 [Pseudoalteromonas sp. BSi20311]|nr:hypothetical protein P20311_2103 [Pseudoalteromonas sp. BSi20311]GAA71566.1 hypothetical protein P20439_1642 [Pseudoalteromonas sp. BSi20439]
MWNPFIHIKTSLKLSKTLFTHYYSAVFILPHQIGAVFNHLNRFLGKLLY